MPREGGATARYSAVPSLVVCSMMLLLFSRCCAKKCPDIALTTAAAVSQVSALDCRAYLDREGVGEMFVRATDTAASLQACSEIRPDVADGSTVQDCICAAGFTDAVYGNALGVLRGLKNVDLARISCQTACPASYQNIARLAHTDACACWNRRGCVFEDRSLLRFVEPLLESGGGGGVGLGVQQSVALLPDSLLYDSSIISCRQLLCAHSTSPHDILICAMKTIEYIYCDECPAECLQAHRSCEIDASTRFCSVFCDDDYVRVFDTGNATYDCVLRQRCPPHHIHANLVNARGEITQQMCASCPVGQDNINAYGQVRPARALFLPPAPSLACAERVLCPCPTLSLCRHACRAQPEVQTHTQGRRVSAVPWMRCCHWIRSCARNVSVSRRVRPSGSTQLNAPTWSAKKGRTACSVWTRQQHRHAWHLASAGTSNKVPAHVTCAGGIRIRCCRSKRIAVCHALGITTPWTLACPSASHVHLSTSEPPARPPVFCALQVRVPHHTMHTRTNKTHVPACAPACARVPALRRHYLKEKQELSKSDKRRVRPPTHREITGPSDRRVPTMRTQQHQSWRLSDMHGVQRTVPHRQPDWGHRVHRLSGRNDTTSSITVHGL